MGFRSPLMLAGLVLVPVVAGLLWLGMRARGRSAVRFAAADMLEGLVPRTASWRKWLPPALLTAAVLFGVLASARPILSTTAPRKRAAIAMTLDVSLSMKATDVKPTRLSAAKSAAVSALQKLPAEMYAGVVEFSSTAAVIAQPTRDHQSAIHAVQGLQYGQGTAIGDGILAAIDSLKTVPGTEKNRAILLMSDGQSELGVDVQFAAQSAKDLGIPIYTVAYGTHGATINLDGQDVPVDVNEADLQTIAQTSGGQAFRALTGDSLEKIFTQVGTKVGVEKVKVNLTPYMIAVAALLLLGALVMSMLWFGRLL